MFTIRFRVAIKPIPKYANEKRGKIVQSRTHVQKAATVAAATTTTLKSECITSHLIEIARINLENILLPPL